VNADAFIFFVLGIEMDMIFILVIIIAILAALGYMGWGYYDVIVNKIKEIFGSISNSAKSLIK
jgi:hypothetical protein